MSNLRVLKMNAHFMTKKLFKAILHDQSVEFLKFIPKSNLHNLCLISSTHKPIGSSCPSSNCKFSQQDRHVNSKTDGNDMQNCLLNFICSKNSSDDMLTVIDMTYGDGHHTNLILENIENVKVICLDRDKASFEKAQRLSETNSRVVPIHGKFSELPKVLKSMNYKFNSIDAILLDVGISDTQVSSSRGFTPNSNTALDMRMDQYGISASQVLAGIEEISLARVLKVYGEEKFSKKLACSIIETRYTFRKLERTVDLNDLVSAVIGQDFRVDSRTGRTEHVAQKVYNGLRRFVNNELNELNYAMIIAEKYLKPNGLVVTQCHSIVEDRIVKRHLTGNVVENSANDLALKFVNHNLSHSTKDLTHLTYSPWNLLSKTIARDSDKKLRVAMKK